MADGGRSYIDHDDRFAGGHFMKKRKGRGPFQGKMYSEGPPKYQNRGYPPNPRSRLDDDDGDTAMSDVHDAARPRFNPYSRGGRKRDDRPGRDRVSSHANMSRDTPHHPRNETREDKSWFKVTIPHGKKYDKGWLIGLLQSACALPFTPVEYHCDHSRAHFFVEDSAVAKALKQISRTFTDRENFKVTILTHSCPPPSFPKSLTDEEIVHLKNCMQKRYDGAQQALNMKAVRLDPGLVENKVDIILNRKACMQAMLQIIEENVPELLSLDLSNNKLYKLDHMSEIHHKAPNLKILNLSENMLRSEKDLDKIKGLKLEMLWLDGNPLCKLFRDQTSYISALRERFPKLLRLDGHDLPPPITFDVETPTTLPPCKGSYLATDDIKALVLRFLQQYYVCYDSEDREGLLNVYHDEACCSLSIACGQGQNPSSSLGEYFNNSRNLKRLRDPGRRFKLLKHKRLNVVSFLNELPRTQHDLNSFVVDITAQSNTLLCFVVNGVFKVEGQSSDPVRAFTRVFIAVPGTDGGLLLVNDDQFIRNATTEEIRKAFATPAPTPSSSPVPVHAPVPQDMVQAFSLFSGMNAEWSQKCLQDNGWDFEQAAQIFMKLKAEGKIPEVAFIK
ncbi:nuclear RNA export factor 1 isoform X2 [Bufo gargarizans]|uniref:nuclear RNA export factor 1 isoform X2 n=1 Tax=Bufo gargarizans TaxID=30331 RepID=UPI001CF1098F|nr:nuclear RNA export factor 1 isoform X2 [Bufo gargarizans]